MIRRVILVGLLIATPALIYVLSPLGSKDIPTVQVITAQRGLLESSIRVTGRVINDRTVTLTALVDGQIQGMLVQKGETVEAGQILAFLDKREADSLLVKSQALVARETEHVDEKQRRLKRLRGVSRAGGASAQTVDDAAAELRAAQSSLRVAHADLVLAQLHRAKVEVKAPFAGVITEKSTEVGQWVEAGIKLFTLVALEGREIEAQVDAGDSATVAIGQSVRVSCDAFAGQPWSETVQWIAPAVSASDNDALNTFAVRMTLGPTAPSLLLGQQVDARILTAHRENALKLPYKALIETNDKTQIAIVREGRIHLVSVRTGIEDLTHVEILEGLSPHDKVVLSGGEKLSEGQMVHVEQTKS